MIPCVRSGRSQHGPRSPRCAAVPPRDTMPAKRPRRQHDSSLDGLSLEHRRYAADDVHTVVALSQRRSARCKTPHNITAADTYHTHFRPRRANSRGRIYVHTHVLGENVLTPRYPRVVYPPLSFDSTSHGLAYAANRLPC